MRRRRPRRWGSYLFPGHSPFVVHATLGAITVALICAAAMLLSNF